MPKSLKDLVEKLGFIDIRSDKMTMTGEERLLLYLYDHLSDHKDIPNFTGIENIEILKRVHVKCRYSEDYYMVELKNAPSVKIKMSEYNSLEIEEEEVKRWA